LNGKNLNGVLNIYKEPGYTSHDVVAILRKILKTKKIGHAGTLDPNVSGVLPICVGKATKISSHLMNMGKTYYGEITFGLKTDTLDIWGNILETNDFIPEKDTIKNEILSFSNKEIEQIPPMYSAIKVNGKKLYELAREGKEIKRKARKVKIYNTEFIDFYDNKVLFNVSCSKGTYIRTLIEDMGSNVGALSTMSYLIRTEAGGMNIKDSITIDQLKLLIENDIDFLCPIDKALYNYPVIDVDAKYFELIKNGAKIKTELTEDEDTIYRVYCNEVFIGLGKILSNEDFNYIKMLNVFV